jgi:MYXO-CTERM domain-containing protein
MLNPALGRFLFAAALAAASLGASAANAEQFVIADATYTHSGQTTSDSHYPVMPTAETPTNWQSPVDYTKGSVHVRLEVKTKPSATPTRFQICFEMKTNYCCTDQAPAYTAPGVYEWDTGVEQLWRPGPVDFTTGVVRSQLILKDTNNGKPSPENVGQDTSALYMPTDLSVTVTVVSNGADYQPPGGPMPSGGSGGAAGSGGMAAGAGGSAGTGGGGAPAQTAGSAGAPVVVPQPNGGTGGMPNQSAGGSDPLPQAGSASTMAPADEASCSTSAGSSGPSRSALLGAVAAFGLMLRRKSFKGSSSRTPTRAR